jgi:DNA-3-methyladenine glycosylase
VTTRGPGRRLLLRSFYRRPTLEVARDLLGKLLVHRSSEGLTSGFIVESEAYIGESDPACHAALGQTPRNEPLYGEPGHAYIYLNYGVHSLVNAVTEDAGTPAAALIRALEPVSGIDLMQARRRRSRGIERPDLRTDELCRGPGNLARAMGITLDDNRLDLTRRAGASLWIEDRGKTIQDIGWSPRIGIRVGTDRLWRCFVIGHPCVSGMRAGTGARPYDGHIRV